MTRQQLLNFHEEMTGRCRELMARKNHDYTGSDGGSPFANFQRTEALGICKTATGMLVRLGDKMSRLATFVNTDSLLVKDENVEDTLDDVVNYAVLIAAWVKSEKERINAATNQT